MEEQEGKTEPAAAEKQGAEQENTGMEERREAAVFGKIPVTASRGILFLEIAPDRVCGDRRTRMCGPHHIEIL